MWSLWLLVTVMFPQQKAQANGQTVSEPQEEIKVIKDTKKPAPAAAPAPAQTPAETKVGPAGTHAGFLEEVCLCLYIYSNNN